MIQIRSQGNPVFWHLRSINMILEIEKSIIALNPLFTFRNFLFSSLKTSVAIESYHFCHF